MSDFHLALLLAEGPTFDDLTRNFRNGGAGITLPFVVFGLSVLAAVVIVLWVVSRWMKIREEQAYNSPRALLRELCRAHGLDRRDRRLLKSLARRQQLEHPSLLFLEPDRFEAGAASASAEERAKFERLRDRLFGMRLDLVAPREAK
jgi:hypothetical protein